MSCRGKRATVPCACRRRDSEPPFRQALIAPSRPIATGRLHSHRGSTGPQTGLDTTAVQPTSGEQATDREAL